MWLCFYSLSGCLLKIDYQFSFPSFNFKFPSNHRRATPQTLAPPPRHPLEILQGANITSQKYVMALSV